jgi:hypothetical protein
MTNHHNFHFLHVSASDSQTIMLISLSLISAVLLAGASASNVLDLTPGNFDQVIGKGKPGLVEL